MKLRGFTDQELIEGGADAERRARDELRREQRLWIAKQSDWPELKREDLVPAHLGLLEDRATGTFYAVSRAEQTGEQHDTAAAYYVDGQDVVFLETPASGPQTRAELEARRSRTAS